MSSPRGDGVAIGEIQFTSRSCDERLHDRTAAARADVRRALSLTQRSYSQKLGTFRFGIVWIVVEPIFTAVLFIFLFSLIRPGEDLRALTIIVGVVTFKSFSSSLMEGMLMLNNIRSKVKVERVRTRVIVIAGVMKSSLDSLFLTIFAGALMIVFFEDVGLAEIGAFGGALLITSTLGRGLGMTLITLHRTFPDMEMIMRYFIQINLYLSPVLYLSSEMHPIQHQVMLFNPFAHIVNIVRDIVMGTDEIGTFGGSTSIVMLCVVALAGIVSHLRLDAMRWRYSNWS